MKTTSKELKYFLLSATPLIFLLFGGCTVLSGSPTRTIVSSSLPVEILWQSQVDETVNQQPFITDDLVIVSTNRAIYGLDIKTGQQRWKHSTMRQPSPAPMTIAENKVIYGDHEGKVSVLDTTTGETLWQRELREGINYSIFVTSLIVDDGVVYAASQPTAIAAIDLDMGEFIWSIPDGSQYGIPSRAALLFLDGKSLYVFTTGLHILDAATGEIKGSSSKNTTPDQFFEGRFYGHNWVRETNGLELIATLKSPSTRMWESSCENFVPPYTFTTKYFYAVGGCGGLYALDYQMYKIRWQYRPEVLARSQPAIYRDRLYVLFYDGEIHVVDPQTGNNQGILKTNLKLPEYFTTSIGVVANQEIVVTTFNDRDVWAFCESPCF